MISGTWVWLSICCECDSFSSFTGAHTLMCLILTLCSHWSSATSENIPLFLCLPLNCLFVSFLFVLCWVFTFDQFRELGHIGYLSGREQLLYTSNCLDAGEITREGGDRRQNSRHVSNSNFLLQWSRVFFSVMIELLHVIMPLFPRTGRMTTAW